MVTKLSIKFNCQKCQDNFDNWPDFHQHINEHFFELDENNHRAQDSNTKISEVFVEIKEFSNLAQEIGHFEKSLTEKTLYDPSKMIYFLCFNITI